MINDVKDSVMMSMLVMVVGVCGVLGSGGGSGVVFNWMLWEWGWMGNLC